MREIAAGRSWDLDRLMHRQTYIDLIRAYLVDYGSQRDLACALGFSEAYASYLLEPLRLTSGGRQSGHWSVLLCAAGHEVAEAFKYVKTPAEVRACQIAEQLLTDADRRDVLLYHINMARRAARPPPDSPAMSAGAARAALEMVGEIHQAALYDPAEPVTASSYARVWAQARYLPAQIDSRLNPAEHAQALMYLHDTAQVLGRPDLALGFARQAIRVLPAGRPRACWLVGRGPPEGQRDLCGDRDPEHPGAAQGRPAGQRARRGATWIQRRAADLAALIP